jgi:hypothetical protein
MGALKKPRSVVGCVDTLNLTARSTPARAVRPLSGAAARPCSCMYGCFVCSDIRGTIGMHVAECKVVHRLTGLVSRASDRVSRLQRADSEMPKGFGCIVVQR